MTKINCTYCNSKAKLVDGSKIYPHRPDLFYKFFYLCETCKAYCGCHPNSKNPLGTLANKDLRKLRKMAHFYFDQIWGKKKMSRKESYAWLAKKMNINVKQTHIAWFNQEQCKIVIDLTKKFLN